MSSADDYPLRHRGRYELKRRYFHRGYLWPWILVLLIPLGVRFVMFYEVATPFQSSSVTEKDVSPDELKFYELLESTPDNVDTLVIQDSSENERSSRRHSTKRSGDEQNAQKYLVFPQEDADDRIEGVVDEVQLRQIGDRIKAIKRWENWEERGRWNAKQDDQPEARQRNETDKAKHEDSAVDKRIVGKDTDPEEDRRSGEVLMASETRKAAGELKAAEIWDDEEEILLADGTEAENENRDAEERGAEEELMAAKEREVDVEINAAERKDAYEQWKAENEQEADGERQRVIGGAKNGQTAKSAEDKRKDGESSNEEGKRQDEKRSDGKEKNIKVEEQKITMNRKEEEKTMKLEEYAEKTTNNQKEEERAVKLEDLTEGDSREKEIEAKQEEDHEDSGKESEEDRTTPNDQTQTASLAEGKCDLFEGDWEYDPSGPLYTNSTCFFVRGDHNCMSNGRPDTDYLHWRWKPRGCDLPRFDAMAFMQAFQGKTIGFIGDSLARNQMQSMLCMLALVEVPIQIQDDSLTTRWFYEQHQVTLAVAWSPYLLKESQEGVMGFEKGQSVLYLDELDPVWTSMMPECDIIVLSVGQWYFKPSVYIMQDEVIGCHNCPYVNITEIGFFQPYSEGWRRALEKVATDWEGIAIVSTIASAHGEHAPGDEGDQCRRESPLDKDEWERSFRGMQNEMRDVVLGEFNRMVNNKRKLNKDLHFEFLDVSTLSLLRADGHPGGYYNAHPYEGKNPTDRVPHDCLHWCLPGPVDTWNQLLVRIVHNHL